MLASFSATAVRYRLHPRRAFLGAVFSEDVLSSTILYTVAFLFSIHFLGAFRPGLSILRSLSYVVSGIAAKYPSIYRAETL